MLKVTEPVRWQTWDSIVVLLSSAPHLGTFPCYSAMTWLGGRVQSHTGYSPADRRLKVECGRLGRGPCLLGCLQGGAWDHNHLWGVTLSRVSSDPLTPVSCFLEALPSLPPGLTPFIAGWLHLLCKAASFSSGVQCCPHIRQKPLSSQCLEDLVHPPSPPPALGNHSSTLCLYRYVYTGNFT